MENFREEYYEDMDPYYSDTAIRDRKAIDFINSIRSRYLKALIRNHFEYQNSMVRLNYDLETFTKEFESYLKNKELGYFIYGLNDHYEDILKMLLKIKEEEL